MPRIARHLSPATVIIAVLALLLAGAGVGYTAGKVDTKDLANNAVTGKKVKNGSLKNADLVPEKRLTLQRLRNGTEGDCKWSDGAEQIPGISQVGWRTDRFGITHLSGIVVRADAPGGDGTCGDGADQIDDLTVYVLPRSARPATSLYLREGAGGIVLIGGPDGLNLGGDSEIPAGGVLCSADGPGCWLDGISFATKKAKVSPKPDPNATLTPQGRELLRDLVVR